MQEYMGPDEDWASIVLIRVFQNPTDQDRSEKILVGYVFVKEVTTPVKELDYAPQWKFPGGRVIPRRDTTPQETAKRETREETGIEAPLEDFIFLDGWKQIPEIREYNPPLKHLRSRGPHWKYLYMLDIYECERNWINSSHPSNGNEDPKFFTPEALIDAIKIDDFKADHLELWEKWHSFKNYKKTLGPAL